ncbi:MAG: gliding motility-associated protein GldE [Bacteroidota bacterium]|nr:gliding motility-associated protein GldE [Bacteroidota bacterium]
MSIGDSYSPHLYNIINQVSFPLELITDFVIVMLLLLATALISGSESAFFSLNSNHIQHLANTDNAQARAVLQLHSRPKKLLATLLIINTVINILIALLLVRILEVLIPGGENEGLRKLVDVLVVTFTLVLLGEVMPKVYATRNNVKFASFMAFPMLILFNLVTPISWLLAGSTRFIERKLANRPNNSVTVDDLRQAIEMTSGGEDISVEEKKILRGIISMSNIPAKQIMRHRSDMVAYGNHLSLTQLLENINKDKYSRVPIFEETLDSIKGILYIKDLLPHLKAEDDFDWSSLIKAPMYIPESKRIDTLLEEFKQKKVHMAIVIDEYGGTEGLVTLEDVLEEIVGDINDEFDDEELSYSRLDDFTFLFDGKTTISDVAKKLELKEEFIQRLRGDAETIGGIMTEQLGKLPLKGEVIVIEHLRITADAVDRFRVRRVKIELKDQIK